MATSRLEKANRKGKAKASLVHKKTQPVWAPAKAIIKGNDGEKNLTFGQIMHHYDWQSSMDDFSYLSNMTPEAIDGLYRTYLDNPETVDMGWRKFFEGFDFARKAYPTLPEKESFSSSEFKVMALIEGYRNRGHLFTRTNPVRERRKYEPGLDIHHFGLEEKDLNKVFQAGSEVGLGPSTLKEIIDYLEKVYCHHIGIEFTYVRNPEKINWLKQQFDQLTDKNPLSSEEKLSILESLNHSVGFEKFLHRKFVGQKRFSLEGGESLIPALKAALVEGSKLGGTTFVMGMAHRGRLNVLFNLFNKPASQIFSEFEGLEYNEANFDGDVKYHLGYDANIELEGAVLNLNLLPNPSHLEAVGPVAQGLARAFAEGKHQKNWSKTVPVLIHGDAAIAGQGVVYEVVQMSGLEGYKTGGTLHLVINNQVGFTTNYLEGRTSTYCTDVAKVVDAPVFHVNADNPEAVVRAMRLAISYRQRYHKDVFVDLLGYRKHGHNEGDEPRFTQPILYKNIDKHPDTYQLYKNSLLKEGVIDEAQATLREKALQEKLESELENSKQFDKNSVRVFLGDLYKDFRRSEFSDFDQSPTTGVPYERLTELLGKLNQLPSDKKFLRKITKIFKDRESMVAEDRIDWALGEAVAYASILTDGQEVRLSGQDSVRGTFSHRHAILRVEDSEEEYTPLNNLSENQAKFSVFNSPLSEYAVMGFEYGYALGNPKGLTLWEAQFGDFNNGAQIIIDQYLSTGEDKWHSQNGLVLLLPHGYEGQGAEHSSARLERFLNLCAEMNMQVVNCTSPANFFHVLRRQMARPFLKPLVVMSPKSLLRHPACTSKLADFGPNTRFLELLDDPEVKDKTQVTQLVFCSGKLYFELAEHKRDSESHHVALIRLEQLFPFPVQQVNGLIDTYPNAARFVWAQEEPENMGAWSFILRVNQKSPDRVLPLEVISQKASASPATGSPKEAAARQRDIIDRVFQSEKVS